MKEINKSFKEMIRHPHTQKFLKILSVVLIAIFVFSLGMAVGFFKGQFSERWDKHYMEVLGGPRSPLSVFSDRDDRAPTPHGTAGQIISYNNGQIMVKGPGDIEDVVIISPNTVIRQAHQQGTTTDIKSGSWITAIGLPDESGRLVASFIRIMPPPPNYAQPVTSIASTTVL